MKGNLKNRPKHRVCAGNDPCKNIIESYEKWFEDLEKELLDVYAIRTEMGEKSPTIRIKEILGIEVC